MKYLIWNIVMKNDRLAICLFLLMFCALGQLFAQQHALNRTFFGKVSVQGKGIPAVAVSDGVQITYTDKKGNYKLSSTEDVNFVFISTPAGFTTSITNGVPDFFRRVSNRTTVKQRFDFELERNDKDEYRHTLVVCADPQVGFDEDVPKLEAVLTDMKGHVRDYFADQAVYGIMCGDIVENIDQVSPTFQDIRRRFTATGIPFFYVAGNHDMDLDRRSNHRSKSRYEAVFGPSYYSFNRGKIHYVVLDDVFSTGRAYGYIGYLEEKQLHWLEQDLAQVPEGSTVMVSMHIPTYSVAARKGEFGKEEIKKVLQNRRALYKLLDPYKAHILSGHEHYQENYVVAPNLLEHVHGALCGIFWQAPYNSDGTPLGYTVYEIVGDEVSWYFKAAGLPKDIQFSAYLPGTDRQHPDALIANVWNYDPAWKVYWYEDGVKVGEMKQAQGWDPDIVKYVTAHQQQFRYTYVGAGPTEHMFYAVPTNKNAQFKIEVIDRFGRVYTAEPRAAHL